MGEERVHLLARKVDTVYLSIESASCNLSCRWYHLLPKSTYLQWSKRVMPSWDGSAAPRSGQPPSSRPICRKFDAGHDGRLGGPGQLSQDGPPSSRPGGRILLPAKATSPRRRETARKPRTCEREDIAVAGETTPFVSGINTDIFYKFPSR